MKSHINLVILSVLTVQITVCDNNNYSYVNLPDEHMQYYFANFPLIKAQCEQDLNCPYREYLNKDKCWGYEYNCEWNKQYSEPHCPGDHKGWVKTKLAQKETFHAQADFGYVKQQIRELKVICEATFISDSSLECTEHFRFCRGRNLMLNFTKLLNRDDPIRYKMDVLDDGDIGGYCELHKERLEANLDHLSPLQSWGPEMRFFKRLNKRPIVDGYCDVVIEKPTFIMKIDATVNMYHHFCDFLNLYASLHLNATEKNAFTTDVNILIWETYTYRSNFEETFEAFTNNPILDLKTFRGDVVCFKNVIFPLLPRMIFGLYYNTPIIYGCEKSGLFDAFSKHVLHRLKIPLHGNYDNKIRITFLSRRTKYRQILNENELIERLSLNSKYVVNKVVFDTKVPFKKQLEVVRNTDVLIGIHGAGLTHLLFLPEWAAVFEVYNCEDPNCYFDLARLKGIKYLTWEDLDKLSVKRDETYEGGAHAKFANYSFDVDEFVRLVKKAAKHVENHRSNNKIFNKINDEL